MLMDNIRSFLESSTIHGLFYIASTKKYVRLSWILVVIAGFIGAGVLIFQSFDSWEESPVKTTVETVPITDITLPKVTVCPPKNTYTDLNYDLMMTENMTLNDDTRDELTIHALTLLQDHLHAKVVRNIDLIRYDERYYNWYQGLTNIQPLPYPYDGFEVYNEMTTRAISGTISTQYFGDKFDAEKVAPKIYYMFSVYSPVNVSYVSHSYDYADEVTLHFEIEKLTMKDLKSGMDKFFIYTDFINDDITNLSRSFTPPENYQEVSLQRKVSAEDLRKRKLKLMPGFRVKWFYKGTVEMIPDVKPVPSFVRNRVPQQLYDEENC